MITFHWDSFAYRAQAKEQVDKAQQDHVFLFQKLKQVKVSTWEQHHELESKKIVVSKLQQRIEKL
jgi:hypothetical protein